MLNPVKRGSAVHVDAKLIIDGTKLKVLGFYFAGAYGTEGTKVVANAQFDFPSSQQGTEPFTVNAALFISLSEIYKFFSLKI